MLGLHQPTHSALEASTFCLTKRNDHYSIGLFRVLSGAREPMVRSTFQLLKGFPTQQLGQGSAKILYLFPMHAVANQPKLSALQQHKCIILQF